jgi:hypothetical protein
LSFALRADHRCARLMQSSMSDTAAAECVSSRKRPPSKYALPCAAILYP